MFRGVLGVALLLGAAPVAAETYYAKVTGSVTEQGMTDFTVAGATSPIKIGDTITAIFTAMTPDTVGSALGMAFGATAGQKVTFQIGDFTWSSAGDFGTSLEPLTFSAGPDPLAGYFSTMDDAPGGGDLRVNGYAFEIGEFGYGLYTGPAFKGVFDSSTMQAYRDGFRLPAPEGAMQQAALQSGFTGMSVPEPESWALMIAGFGLAGTAIRRRHNASLRFA